MKNLLFLTMAFFLLLVNLTDRAAAQTTGTLTFSVTTTEPAGNYNNVNVIALWIEDTNGNFVKTKIRYAADRIQYLNKWVTASAYNVTDAVTGATRTNHGTLTFSWNATNVAGTTVTDKFYRVYLQMTDANNSGQFTYVQFEKGADTITMNPADVGNFTNMSLSWIPAVAGVNERAGEKLQLDCSPNPVKQLFNISYYLDRPADVTITLHDLSGRNIAVLEDGNRPAGAHHVKCDVSEIANLSSGLYYLRINTGSASAVKKVAVTR